MESGIRNRRTRSSGSRTWPGLKRSPTAWLHWSANTDASPCPQQYNYATFSFPFSIRWLPLDSKISLRNAEKTEIKNLSALSSLLQRVRAQAGPIESVLRRAESVHETPVGAQLSYDLRRRRAIARLYLCRGCGRTVRQSGARSGRRRKNVQRG